MRAMRATSNTPGMNAFCSKQEKKKLQFSKLLYEQGALLSIYLYIETAEIIVPNNKRRGGKVFATRQCRWP